MKTIADINAIRMEMKPKVMMRENPTDSTIYIKVKMSDNAIAAGARVVFNALLDEVLSHEIKNVKVIRDSSISDDKYDPIVEVVFPNKEKFVYVNLDANKAKQVINNHILNGEIIKDYLMDKE